jgi:hypothetical protein
VVVAIAALFVTAGTAAIIIAALGAEVTNITMAISGTNY